MLEDAMSGDEDANTDDVNWDMDSSKIVQVKTLHISSPILAAKSPFFYKLGPYDVEKIQAQFTDKCFLMLLRRTFGVKNESQRRHLLIAYFDETDLPATKRQKTTDAKQTGESSKGPDPTEAKSNKMADHSEV